MRMSKNSMRHIRLGLNTGAAVLALAGLPLSPVFAQAGASGDSSPAGSQAVQPAGLDEIVVTAQRREQRLTEVPVSVQAIGSLAIERAVITTTNDLLKLTPSVAFTQGAGPANGSVAIRGIASITQEGGIQPSTAVIIDEVPVTRQGEFVADLADVERVEVLRGPQGTLFGKNATAGVINIVSKKPTDAYEGSFELGYTTDDEKLIRGVVNIPLSNAIRTRFSAYWRDQDHLLDNRATLVQSENYRNTGGAENYGVSGKIAIDLSDNADLLVSGDLYHQRTGSGALVILVPNTNAFLGGVQAAAGVVAPFNHPFINSDSGSANIQKGGGVSANLTVSLSDQLTLKSISAYREYFTDSVTDADSGPWGAQRGFGLYPNPFGYPFAYVLEANGGLPRAPDKSKYFSEELRINYAGDRLNLVFGGFMQLYVNRKHNTVPFVGFLNPADPAGVYFNDNIIDAKVKDDVYSAFADATFDLSDAISVFGGLRYSHEKLALDYRREAIFTPSFDRVSFTPSAPGVVTNPPRQTDTTNNLSGRLGVKYQPSTAHSYYASFARGYKGPAADISRSAVPGSQFLKPEIATAFEVGTKHEFFNNRLNANLALFYQKTDDIQQSALIPGAGTATRLQNAGNIVAYGGELDLAARLSSSFRVNVGLAYVDAEYRNLINACYPGQTAAQGCIGGSQDLDGAQANGSPRFSGSISGNYDITLPASVPFDAFVRVSYLHASKIQFGLTNDPLLRQPGRGQLDATLGLIGRENRWQLSLYGRNLTNKAFYSNLSEANNFIARAFGNYTRDIKRYGGVQLKVAF